MPLSLPKPRLGVRQFVTRRPAWTVLAWLILTGLVAALAPDLTKLAAEGQAGLIPENAESARAAGLLRELWPDQWFESLALVALHRPEGLTDADAGYARALERRLGARDRPEIVLRVLGPGATPEIAERLVSRDGTLRLVLVPLSQSFVAPVTQRAVGQLEAMGAEVAPPPGLSVRWSGDAVIGRGYMEDVQTSLDRAALATVFLLLAVLLVVYRSPLLALVPLATIGIGVVLSRGALGWLAVAGWEVSPLVELFLIVILFGCGTDFCLLISWRFGEHWNAANPAGAMRTALRHSTEPLLTSAGTVMVGLLLMGTTQFKLFSSTGPSVALGLAITLAACLTLTPALLILLAQRRPRAFAWMTRPSSGLWDDIGRRVLARPWQAIALALLVMVPVGVLGLTTKYLQDLLSEMRGDEPPVQTFRLVAEKFGPGTVAPLTVLVRADADLRSSDGLALIDDLSRLLARQRRLVEVRSATQPLGSTAPLEPARLSARLGTVNDGFGQIADGAQRLQKGLLEGAARLDLVQRIRRYTGVDLTATPGANGQAIAKNLSQATAAMFGGKPATPPAPAPAPAPPAGPGAPESAATGDKAADPIEAMRRELVLAADGAGQIAAGSTRARKEVSAILDDPVGRRALDRLLITRATIRDYPDLQRSLDTYISPDGRLARFDLIQADRLFSTEAMRQVNSLRRRIREFLTDQDEVPIAAVALTGSNAQSADIWAMTQHDQRQTWVVVPLGVFLILLLTLRDVWACANLVATMVLTYAFALGITHLVFVTALGAEGLDWKVPLFLFVLLVAVGVDYNIFLMTRLQQEVKALGLKAGINRAVAQTGGLISSAAAITVCSFAAFLFSPLASLRQLGFALIVGITVDAMLVRPILVPCGHWLIHHRVEGRRRRSSLLAAAGSTTSPAGATAGGLAAVVRALDSSTP